MSSLKRPDDTDNNEGSQKKRRKGATRLSCAECRRLKLRCDRAIPCSSCVKRGCGAICPDGSLTTGQGNRFVLASTQELHEKISELSHRVRTLEDGLRASHSQLSISPHPLLSDDLLRIKAPLQREVQPSTDTGQNKEEESNPDVVDAFGSLSLSLSGRAKYYGQIANSWYFLQNEEREDDHIDDRVASLQNVLPQKVLTRASAFPITHVAVDPETSLQSLYWYLPPAEKAVALRSIYYRHAAWMYNPISQELFDAEVYHQFYDPSASTLVDDPVVAHRLSLLFIVLAIGTLMDTSLPAYNIEAEKFHQLSRAALFQTAFFEAPTINAVQALYLMTYYLFLADRHGSSSGARWGLMGIAVKVAQSIGLHRDSGRWNGVDPTETQRRRELFWELITYDSWQCMTFGRPPSIALPHIDCKMPNSGDPSDANAFHAWKHRYTTECLNLLHDQVFGAKTPTYATVLQLDRKLRAFPVPPILQVVGFGSSEPRAGGYPESNMLTLQRHVVLAIRETNLLYLHRSFFARAIGDHPKDPLGSPYGTSVIAAYRSAGSLVALMRNLHAQLKDTAERIWFLWTHMFSCAIVLGSIVTRCPSMSLAPSALVQLDSACDLFSKAAEGFRAGKVLNIMLRLQERAHASLDDFRKGRMPSRTNSLSEAGSPTEENDELAMLGGRSRLVKEEIQHLDRSPTTNHPIVPLPLGNSVGGGFDPNVLEYLSSFQSNGQQALRTPHSASTHNSFSEIDVSPVSVYGMSPMSGAYHSEPSSYNTPYSHMRQQEYPQQPQQQTNGGIANHSSTHIPSYFPVYDYGSSTMPTSSTFNVQTPLLDMPMPSGQRRASGSPESNTMNATWQDFVATLGV